MKTKRKYFKVPMPRLNDFIVLGQAIFCIMVGSLVLGAVTLALCMMIEIFFKVKLIS